MSIVQCDTCQYILVTALSRSAIVACSNIAGNPAPLIHYSEWHANIATGSPTLYILLELNTIVMYMSQEVNIVSHNLTRAYSQNKHKTKIQMNVSLQKYKKITTPWVLQHCRRFYSAWQRQERLPSLQKQQRRCPPLHQVSRHPQSPHAVEPHLAQCSSKRRGCPTGNVSHQSSGALAWAVLSPLGFPPVALAPLS